MAGQVSIHDMNIRYDVSHRDIKYARLEFKTGRLLLVLPRNTSADEVISKHKRWIYKKSQEIRAALNKSKGKKLDFKRTDEEFRDIAYSCVNEISEEMDPSINNLFFRKMTSKWGSCSSKKNITINTMLRYLPKHLIEYVIFHEMIHLIERKHNERFWEFVSSKFEDHQDKEEDLLVYWFSVQRQMGG